MESLPSPGKRTKRYCKKCNVIFGGESCPGKHPNFMWTKELPGSDKGLVIDVEEKSVLQKVSAIQLSEGASEGPKSPGSPGQSPRTPGARGAAAFRRAGGTAISMARVASAAKPDARAEEGVPGSPATSPVSPARSVGSPRTLHSPRLTALSSPRSATSSSPDDADALTPRSKAAAMRWKKENRHLRFVIDMTAPQPVCKHCGAAQKDHDAAGRCQQDAYQAFQRLKERAPESPTLQAQLLEKEATIKYLRREGMSVEQELKDVEELKAQLGLPNVGGDPPGPPKLELPAPRQRNDAATHLGGKKISEADAPKGGPSPASSGAGFLTDAEARNAVKVYEANYGMVEGAAGWTSPVPGTHVVDMKCELLDGVQAQVLDGTAQAPRSAFTLASAPAPAPAKGDADDEDQGPIMIDGHDYSEMLDDMAEEDLIACAEEEHCSVRSRPGSKGFESVLRSTLKAHFRAKAQQGPEPEPEPEPEPSLLQRMKAASEAHQELEDEEHESLPEGEPDGPIMLDGHDYAEMLDEMEEEDLLACAEEEHCSLPPRQADGDYTAALRSVLKTHFRGVRELFSAVDADGSGGLDTDELGNLCDRLGITMSADEVATALKEMDTDGDGTADFQEFAAWFKKVRSDLVSKSEDVAGTTEEADGPIMLDGHDYAEMLDEMEEEDLLACAEEEHCSLPPRPAEGDYTSVLRSALKMHFRGVRKLFSAVDADGSGGLDTEELGKLCGRLGIAMSPEEVATALKDMDTDGDGTADFQEFAAWYKKVRAESLAKLDGPAGAADDPDGPIMIDGHDYAEMLDEMEEEDLLSCAEEEHCAVPARPEEGDYAPVLRSALKAHFRQRIAQ